MATATATRKPRSPRRTAAPAVRLLLGIDAQFYRVFPIRPGAWRLRKMGPEDQVYDVAQEHEYGPISCTCADWTYRRDGITPDPCKHGAALIELGLLS